MLPTRDEAMALIRDGLSNNPGPWGKHSLTAAHCAEKIAAACGDIDEEVRQFTDNKTLVTVNAGN